MNVGEKIKYQRKRFGYTQSELGNLVGVKKSAVAKWEKGLVKNLKRTTIARLAEIFEVKPSYFVIDDDETIYKNIEMSYIKVPLYGSLCCGNGGFVDENIIDMIPVPNKGLNTQAKYFAQYAKGESMKDAGISDGDLLIFQRVDKIDSGVIGCFCNEDNVATCKKYKEIDGLVILQPMNIDYEPIVIDPLKDNFRCLGKLKKVIKDFNWED